MGSSIKTHSYVILLANVLICLFSTPPLVAATNSELHIQINSGLALVNLPEEGDFTNPAIPFEIFLDYDLGPWTEFRVGFNSSMSKFEFRSFISDGQSTASTTVETRLISRSVYVAYKYSLKLSQMIDLFAYGGFAYFRSALEIDYGLSNTTSEDSSTGYILGSGGQYSLGAFGVGGQFQYTTSEADFGNTSYKIGANQLQIFVFYEF